MSWPAVRCGKRAGTAAAAAACAASLHCLLLGAAIHSRTAALSCSAVQDVAAACAASQQGVLLVAGAARTDLHSLLRDSVLRPLVADGEAAASGAQAERSPGMAPFSSVLVLRGRDRCGVKQAHCTAGLHACGAAACAMHHAGLATHAPRLALPLLMPATAACCTWMRSTAHACWWLVVAAASPARSCGGGTRQQGTCWCGLARLRRRRRRWTQQTRWQRLPAACECTPHAAGICGLRAFMLLAAMRRCAGWAGGMQAGVFFNVRVSAW